jgi:hypothetical protein
MGIRISQLPETKTIDVTEDLIPIVQEGITKKILLDYVKHPDQNSVFNNVKGLSSNWNSVYTSVLNTSADWNSVYTSVLNTSADWNSVYTSVLNTSADWNSVYTSVLNTSADWNSVYTSVLNTSADWNSVYTSVSNTSADWNSVYTSVLNTSASNASINYVSSNYLPLTGGTITGNLYVLSSVEIMPNNLITTFYVEDQKVGINTETPNVELTVNGKISSNNTIYDKNGNSDEWNSTYTSVKDTSANWDSVYTTIQSNSAYYFQISTASVIIAQSGDSLAAKYTEAKALTPNGSAKSAANRASLIIFPGNYALSDELAIDAEFVDVIGVGSQTRNPAVILDGGTFDEGLGVTRAVNVSANNVRVSGISAGTHQFKITGNKPLQFFENCIGGNYSFGGEDQGIASGTFISCVGGSNCFGGPSGIISGVFINCKANAYSFGGYLSTVSGTFTNCEGGAFNFGMEASEVSGRFTNCTALYAGFGGVSGTVSGTFTNCTAGSDGFGGFEGILKGTLINCRVTSGGFRSLTAPASGKALMINCIDGSGNIIEGEA